MTVSDDEFFFEKVVLQQPHTRETVLCNSHSINTRLIKNTGKPFVNEKVSPIELNQIHLQPKVQRERAKTLRL
jgi:hypothetical protein